MPSSDTIPQQAGQYMETRDLAGQHLGLKLVDISPGTATVIMTVRPDMVNGHGICHGGVTYTLADTCFAYACNSRNEKSLALNCSITYTKAVEVGDTLTATGHEITLKGHNGVYDITVTNQRKEVVALFRGNAYRTRESVIPE